MSIYQHFRAQEKEFIDLVLNWRDYVETHYAPKLTDFLNPREQFIVQSIIGQNPDCMVRFFSGTDNGERKRALIYPEYFVPNDDDFQITLFEIDYPEKFITITHPKVLGSLMGLGLKRGKYGDILIHDKQVQFFAAKEIAEYIQLNFHAVGKTTVLIAERPLTEAIKTVTELIESVITVSSIRLDSVLTQVSRLSRQKAQALIQEGVVKVNWAIVESPSYSLHEGDIISAKGVGRIKIIEIGDLTKKNKYRINVGLYK